MTPNERLMQRLGVDASKTATRPQERQAAPSAPDSLRARLDVKKVEAQPSRAAPLDVRAASSVFATSVNTQALRDHTMGAGHAPRGPSAQQAAGRPADRLTARLATLAPAQPSQGRPAPSPQRQQAPSGPAARLSARLAAGGTEKIAAAVAQQQQRGPTPGRGM